MKLNFNRTRSSIKFCKEFIFNGKSKMVYQNIKGLK
jgi:hypothetical protein